MKDRRFIGAIILALTIGTVGTINAQVANVDAASRQIDLINGITAKFQAEAAAQFGAEFNAAEWKRDFGARLLYHPVESLQAALRAPSLSSAQAALANSSGKPAAKHGPDDNLAFTFLPAPCRVLDTRFAVAGMMPGGAWRSITVSTATAAVIANQGGNAAGCGAFPNADAFVLNVTVVGIGPLFGGGANFLTVQHDQAPTPPTSNNMIYYPGEIISNLAMSTCNGCGGSTTGTVQLFTSNAVHVIFDLVAVMGQLGPENLDCTTISTDFTIPASNSSFNAVSGTCAAGTSLTGGGMDTNFTSASMMYYQDSPDGTVTQRWRCRGRNVDFGAAFTGQCYAICCRIPRVVGP